MFGAIIGALGGATVWGIVGNIGIAALGTATGVGLPGFAIVGAIIGVAMSRGA